jgi:N-acetylglucosamine-6-sulfatase
LLIESPLHDPQRVFAAIRTDRYLYAEYANGDRELYDLARDPNELTSLHADPAYTATRKQLAKKLAALRRCRGKSCSSAH